ncbi:DUF262 domain-containing HNH endonuclease family protein [Azospirillum sp.]|uniref:DUF262 domain-containing protein n=1 Tax=Azospirillum sp. TaxID=34012 RepID=UPI002D65B333|nr:DUF262 domain-containing HNH endonuclease family protein [Azospirillum sp.]HYF88325.1 DUF262 domain-containing HNH endonuclease family protein [Azospirillum sp.]
MPNTIKAEERALLNIFCNDFWFRIPTYQRPYAWKTEQVGELLEDLRNALAGDDPRRQITDVSPYFLGSIVLIKAPDRAEADVVDGQQRLTTLTILFAVLRELAQARVADTLHSLVCEEGNPLTGAVDRFRLQLRDQDRLYFQRLVQERGGLGAHGDDRYQNDSQCRIRENALFLNKKLSAMTAAERDRLATFLIQRCYLVVVSASDQQSAFRIFSVMNNRGLDLSPTDILKADVIGALPETQRADYTEIWEDIEEELTRDGFTDLFGHIRMIEVKAKAQRSLVEEMQQQVRPAAAPAAFIDDKLAPYAEAFAEVRAAEYQGGNEAQVKAINARLRYLGRLDNADWIPPAVLYFARHRGNPAALLAFTHGLERLAYSLFIRRVWSTDRIARYARLLQSIDSGDLLGAEGSPLQLSAMEQRETLDLLNGNIYEVTRVRLPLLLRLDALLSDDGVVHEVPLVTVEHVLPQNPAPGSEWLRLFPDEGERIGWTHRLANLVLLSGRKNAQASNFTFDRKKREYFTRGRVATFALTTQVLSIEQWTPELLENRQRTLLGTLAEEWQLNVR